ncbi:MAG: oligosaccharide flippase family protein [Bacteroidetes bacterium]|jgi:O-antigen/teichoic acid export membrane protein|nr:oligosaccharide flippase family protein [Bacteroidota bacterium]
MAASRSFFGRIKQLASETAIYGVSSIVGRMLNFLLFPFYSHVFPPEAYGVLSIVYAAFIFFNIVYQYGMESAYLKYATDAPDRRARQQVFSTVSWSLLVTSLGLGALLLLGRVPVASAIGLEQQWTWLLYYVALILLLDTLAIVPFAELRLQHRPWRFAIIRLLNVSVNIGLNLYLILGLGMGIEAVFLANAIASGVTVVLLLPQYAAQLRLCFDRQVWRKLLRFGLPFIPGGLGYAIADRVNLFYLKRLDGDTVQALYGDALDTERLQAQAEAAARGVAEGHDKISPEVGQQMLDAANAVYGSYVVGVFNGVLKLAILMMLLMQMFRFAWQPFFLQRASDPDARRLFARIFTLLTAAGLLVFLGVSFFARELVAIPLPGDYELINPRYWMGLFIVPVALIGYLFQGWYYVFSAGAYLTEKTRYFVHCTLAGATVALIANAVLVPTFGMLGAAWATTLAYATMALMLLLIVQRFYYVPYEWGRVGGMFGLAVGLYGAWELVPTLQHPLVEVSLLGVFAGSLLALRIIPPRSLRRLVREWRAGRN